MGNSRGLVASIEGSLVGIVHWGEGGRWERRRSRRLGGSEPGAPQDQFAQLGNRDPFGRVELKYAPHDGIQFRRNGENGPKELGIFHVSPKGGILERGPLPWVTAASEVHQDDP